MVRKHFSRAGCRAGAAMNLNQMTFIGAQQITGEKFSSLKKIIRYATKKYNLVCTFTFLEKCEHCSLVALFTTSANK